MCVCVEAGGSSQVARVMWCSYTAVSRQVARVKTHQGNYADAYSLIGGEQTLVAVPCVARSAFALRPNSCGSLFPVGQMSAIAARAIFMRLRIEVLSHMRQSMKFLRWVFNFANQMDTSLFRCGTRCHSSRSHGCSNMRQYTLLCSC